MKRISAYFLVTNLVLTACGDDGGTPTTTTDGTGTTGSSTTNTDGGPGATQDPTTEEPTTATPTSDPMTSTSVSGDPTTENTDTTATTTTEATDTSATETSDTSDTSDTMVGTEGGGLCGDGAVDVGEACDDSNLSTEISESTKSPSQYEATACIDDCSLVLSLCGNGTVDAGEACDDGNQDSYDDCTTSCTVNDQGYHAPCKRTCNQNCDTDVTSGTFTGCDNMEVPEGAEAVCYVSTKFNLAKRYFAEGECATTAQICEGIACPADVGNYDLLKACPAGTTLIDRTTDAGIVKVQTKVCQKICESDSDCRWNSWDTIWAKPGQFRCQETADSKGVKICADAQN